MDTGVNLSFSEIVESIKVLVSAEKLGRKSGVDFYEYDDDGNVVQ